MAHALLIFRFRHAYQQENRGRREEIKMNVFGRPSEIVASHSLPQSCLKRSKAILYIFTRPRTCRGISMTGKETRV